MHVEVIWRGTELLGVRTQLPLDAFPHHKISEAESKVPVTKARRVRSP